MCRDPLHITTAGHSSPSLTDPLHITQSNQNMQAIIDKAEPHIHRDRAWDEEFQELLDCTVPTPSVETAAALTRLLREFHAAACAIAELIVAEELAAVERTDPEARILRSIDAGGVAGGLKFSAGGLFFKLVSDQAGLYGSVQAAARVAGLELAGASLLASQVQFESGPGEASSSQPGKHPAPLRPPLMTCVDVAGRRVLVFARLAINDDSLVYGSPDAGRTVRCDAEAHARMQAMARALNIAQHAVGPLHAPVQLAGPVDIEVHRTGGRLYALDTARLMPPDATALCDAMHTVHGLLCSADQDSPATQFHLAKLGLQEACASLLEQSNSLPAGTLPLPPSVPGCWMEGQDAAGGDQPARPLANDAPLRIQLNWLDLLGQRRPVLHVVQDAAKQAETGPVPEPPVLSSAASTASDAAGSSLTYDMLEGSYSSLQSYDDLSVSLGIAADGYAGDTWVMLARSMSGDEYSDADSASLQVHPPQVSSAASQGAGASSAAARQPAAQHPVLPVNQVVSHVLGFTVYGAAILLTPKQAVHLTHLMRPEAVQLSKSPLSSDVFTRFASGRDQQAQHEAAALAASSALHTAVIPDLIRDVQAGVVVLHSSRQVADALHARGINLRYLGAVLAKLPGVQVELALSMAVEIVKRCVKAWFRATMAAVSTAGMDAMRQAVARALDEVTGSGVAADTWWHFTLPALVAIKFGSCYVAYSSVNSLADPVIAARLALHRLAARAIAADALMDHANLRAFMTLPQHLGGITDALVPVNWQVVRPFVGSLDIMQGIMQECGVRLTGAAVRQLTQAPSSMWQSERVWWHARHIAHISAVATPLLSLPDVTSVAPKADTSSAMQRGTLPGLSESARRALLRKAFPWTTQHIFDSVRVCDRTPQVDTLLEELNGMLENGAVPGHASYRDVGLHRLWRHTLQPVDTSQVAAVFGPGSPQLALANLHRAHTMTWAAMAASEADYRARLRQRLELLRTHSSDTDGWVSGGIAQAWYVEPSQQAALREATELFESAWRGLRAWLWPTVRAIQHQRWLRYHDHRLGEQDSLAAAGVGAWADSVVNMPAAQLITGFEVEASEPSVPALQMHKQVVYVALGLYAMQLEAAGRLAEADAIRVDLLSITEPVISESVQYSHAAAMYSNVQESMQAMYTALSNSNNQGSGAMELVLRWLCSCCTSSVVQVKGDRSVAAVASLKALEGVVRTGGQRQWDAWCAARAGHIGPEPLRPAVESYPVALAQVLYRARELGLPVSASCFQSALQLPSPLPAACFTMAPEKTGQPSARDVAMAWLDDAPGWRQDLDKACFTSTQRPLAELHDLIAPQAEAARTASNTLMRAIAKQDAPAIAQAAQDVRVVLLRLLQGASDAIVQRMAVFDSLQAIDSLVQEVHSDPALLGSARAPTGASSEAVQRVSNARIGLGRGVAPMRDLAELPELDLWQDTFDYLRPARFRGAHGRAKLAAMLSAAAAKELGAEQAGVPCDAGRGWVVAPAPPAPGEAVNWLAVAHESSGWHATDPGVYSVSSTTSTQSRAGGAQTMQMFNMSARLADDGEPGTPVATASFMSDTQSWHVYHHPTQSSMSVVGGAHRELFVHVPSGISVTGEQWDELTAGGTQCPSMSQVRGAWVDGAGTEAMMEHTLRVAGVHTDWNEELDMVTTPAQWRKLTCLESRMRGDYTNSSTVGHVWMPAGPNLGSVTACLRVNMRSTTDMTSASADPTSCAVARTASDSVLLMQPVTVQLNVRLPAGAPWTGSLLDGLPSLPSSILGKERIAPDMALQAQREAMANIVLPPGVTLPPEALPPALPAPLDTDGLVSACEGEERRPTTVLSALLLQANRTDAASLVSFTASCLTGDVPGGLVVSYSSMPMKSMQHNMSITRVAEVGRMSQQDLVEATAAAAAQ